MFAKIFTFDNHQVLIQKASAEELVGTMCVMTRIENKYFHIYYKPSKNLKDLFDSYTEEDAKKFLEWAKSEYKALPVEEKGH